MGAKKLTVSTCWNNKETRNSKLVLLKQTKVKRFEEVDIKCIEGKTKLGENFANLMML
jgi:hypothetical protein